jgi:hypothetical protein
VGETANLAQQVYLRLRIENRGLTFAKNVSVYVTRIEYAPQQGGAQNVFDEEVLSYGLAPTGETVFNLAAGAHRYVDLVHTQESLGQLRLHFDFKNGGPIRLMERGFREGNYWYTVFVAAENAASASAEASWSWDGTLDGLRIRRDLPRHRG